MVNISIAVHLTNFKLELNANFILDELNYFNEIKESHYYTRIPGTFR